LTLTDFNDRTGFCTAIILILYPKYLILANYSSIYIVFGIIKTILRSARATDLPLLAGPDSTYQSDKIDHKTIKNIKVLNLHEFP